MRKYSSTYLLLLILILGTFLRFYRMRYLSTFLTDQAIELAGARQILNGKFTLIGIKTSISEVRNGAVMYYLLAPLLYIFRLDPIAGGVLQALLSIATIVLTFFLGKKVANNQGLLAAYFIAASSLLVKFSRQTMLAFYPLFFTGLSLFLSIKIATVKNNKNRYILMLGFLLGFILQIHYSTISIWLFAILLPFIINIGKKIYYYSQLILGTIVGFSPLLLFELRHEFFNTKMFINYLFEKEHNGLNSSFNLFYYWLDAIGKVYGGEKLWLGGLLLAIIFLGMWRWRKNLNILEKLCFGQLVATLFFTIFFVRDMVVHYTIAAFVPIALLLAGFLERTISSFRIKKPLGIYIVIIFSYLLLNYSHYGLQDNHGWTMAKGWDLVGTEKTARIISNDIKDETFNVAMVVNTQNRGIPLRYFLNNWGKTPLSYENYSGAELLYVLAEPGINLDEMTMWEIVSFGPFQIDKIWPIQNDFLLYRLSHRYI